MPRLTDEDLGSLYRELGNTVCSGIPLTDFENPWQSHGPKRLARLWQRVVEEIRHGVPLSSALGEKSPRIDGTALALIRAGEQSGDTEEILSLLSHRHSNRAEVKRCFQVALAYPTLIISLLTLLVFVPRYGLLASTAWFIEIYEQLGAELPSPTLAVIQFSRRLHYMFERLSVLLGNPLALAAALLLIAALALELRWRSRIVRRIRTTILCNLPVLGSMIVTASLSNWCHTVGFLLRRRVSISLAMEIAEGTLDHPELIRASREVRRQVGNGQPLSTSAMATNLLPARSVPLVERAEKRAHLDNTLLRLGDRQRDELNRQVRSFREWLEPVLIMTVGVVVLFTAITFFWALMLPLFAIPRVI
jgi:type II secretory pathway component PulF